MSIKRRTFCGNGIAGWYEEDQDSTCSPGSSRTSLDTAKVTASPCLMTDRSTNFSRHREVNAGPSAMADDELEGFVNAHAIDGIVFKLLKNK